MKTGVRFVLLPIIPVIFMALLARAEILPFHNEGFGANKKKVTLHRKLPAAVRLPGKRFSIKVGSPDPKNGEVIAPFISILSSDLLKYDKELKIDDAKPDMILSATITNYSVPAAEVIVRTVLTHKKTGKFSRDLRPVEVSQNLLKITGSMNVSYSVTDKRTKHVIDSDNIAAKYAEEFHQDSGDAKSWQDAVPGLDKLRRISSLTKKTEEEKAPTPQELQQLLIRRIVSQITARLVNTDENVEVFLARGKLDDANKLAEKALWTRFLESLETMQPLPTKEQEAYRIYNIGVAYEAQAYQAEDPKTVRKFLGEAAVNYSKAIDDNPSEKNFLEPQNRITSALAHYRKLGDSEIEAHGSASPVSNASLKESILPGARVKGTSRGLPSKSTSAKEEVSGPLANEQVIELSKAGMDEANLVSTIQDASSVNFDLSVKGQLELLQNGIKGKVLAAMRQRAARAHHSATASTHHTSSPK